MTLKKYLQILAKRIWILILIVLVVILGTYFFFVNQDDNYIGSMTIYTIISPEEQSASGEYQYGSYYELKSNDLLASTVSSWLKDPSKVNEIFDEANVDLENIDISDYSKLINSEKIEESALYISTKTQSQSDTDALISSAKNMIDRTAKEWKEEGYLKNANIETSDPITVKEIKNMTMTMAAAFIISIFLSLMIIYFVDYMSREK